MSCTNYDAVYPKRGCYPNKLKSGVSSKLSYPTVSESARGRNRFILRNVWQTAPKGTLLAKNHKYSGKWANSSFRILNNAGDVLSRKNYSCGGSNMIGSRPGTLNFTYRGGQSKTNCDGTDIPPSTCNVKYVYDSSDFTRYRKLRAVNKGYVAPNYSDGGATSVYSLTRNKQPCQSRCEVKNNRLSYNYDEVLNNQKNNQEKMDIPIELPKEKVVKEGKLILDADPSEKMLSEAPASL